MKQKNILLKIFLVALAAGKKTRQPQPANHSSLAQSFLLSRRPATHTGEGYTYRSVTACIH